MTDDKNVDVPSTNVAKNLDVDFDDASLDGIGDPQHDETGDQPNGGK